MGLSRDVADETQVRKCVEQTVAAFGCGYLACNNEGIHVPSVETADALTIEPAPKRRISMSSCFTQLQTRTGKQSHPNQCCVSRPRANARG
jgi:hypothetical protein